MRHLSVVLALLASHALAADVAVRPSARLLAAEPDALLRRGACVVYREGGGGSLMTDPVFFVTGQVIDTRVEMRRLGTCPEVSGKSVERYSRDEFVRLALAYPCVSEPAAEHEALFGMVRLRVADWDTPHARAAANAGRLYRGMYNDQELIKGIELELEADLIGTCNP